MITNVVFTNVLKWQKQQIPSMALVTEVVVIIATNG